MGARYVFILSAIILLGLLVYLFWPNVMSVVRPEVDLERIEGRYREFISEKEIADPIPDVNIVVTKSNRVLYLLSGDELIERWRVALGRNPSDEKTTANDGRTPVGIYRIIDREDDSPNHLFLMLDYPNRRDADVALYKEIITEREHQDIYRSLTNERLPPQETALGGGIGIHGGGVTRNWTNGSIAVEDSAIEILWFACPDGTPVIIYEDFDDWELSGVMPSYVE